jgi:hypothetical protein
MERIPFDPYDFFWYMASGLLILVGMQIIWGFPPVMGHDLHTFDSVLVLFAVYVAGQLVAWPAKALFQDFLVGRILGTPSVNLFKKHKPLIQGFLFPAFYRPFPDVIRKRILERSEREGVATVGETLFLHVRYSPEVLEVVILFEKATASPAEFRARVCSVCGKKAFQPLLIPPSWDKSEYREIMQPIWAKAVEELRRASRICIVGYSMPEADSFFKYLMALALSENHNLYKFIVVDKSAETLNRYEQLLDPVFRERRFVPHEAEFATFLSMGNSLTELGRGELVGQSVGRM